MNKAKHFKRLWGTLLLLVAMLMPQGAWAANHYDAGYESTATTYSAAGIKFKITAVRMYNYQGNNSQFRSNPLVTITAGGHTHTFYLGSLTSNTGKDTFYYNGEGNENPYKGSGSFSKRTYQQTVDGIPVKAYFDNQKNEQRVSTNPDKTYKDNGDGSSKWCTADLTIEIGVQTAAMVTIAGNWGDYSDGINKTESYSWSFNIPKHTCNSDIQSNTYRESAATCTAAAVYYKSCSLCGAAQSSTFTSGSALGHSYGAGAWSWEDDGHTATCTRTCGRTGCTTKTTGHTSSKSVTLNNGITDALQVAPSCTGKGTTRYKATATVEGTQYTATKDVQDIAALGHSYGAGAWSWEDDGHSATCTRTCGRTGCTTNTTGHTSSKSVTLNNGITPEQQVAPKCTEKGTTLYTATATVEGTQYKATKEVVDIAALGHSYGEGVWSWKWDDEEHSATCTRTCTRNTCTDKTTGHTASAKVTLNNGIDDGEVTQPATCSAMGTTTYTATATVENVEYKSTHEVADIAMLPHTFNQHVCTVCSADEEPAVTGTQGECTWRIYASDGEMIVSPTNGVSGSLGSWDETPSWYEQRTEIKSVRFTGSVVANTLYQVFHQCNNITSIDLTNLNTSQVQNMRSMFNQCHNLTTINWGSFDTSNATEISFMFNECKSLTSLDLRCFNTSNVTLMNSVFQTCTNLTSVDLSSLNTDKVENFSAMFIGCYKLTNLDLSNFNTVNATNMNYMFEYCGELESLTIGNFDMSKVTYCSEMFDGTNNLSTLTLTSVPYLKEGTFDTKFAGKTVICNLDEKSTVYEGSNNLPTITQCNHFFSVTDASVAANCGETGLTEGSHCKVCAEVLVAQEVIPNSGNHTFAANDPAQSVCTVCNHGFFRYTATAKVKPWDNTLLNADGVSIYNAEKHTFADGKGVMEFDSPLAIIDGAAFAYQNALTAIDLRSISLVGTDAFAECPNLTSVTARCDLDLSYAGINESIVTRKHDYVVMSDDETYLVSAADCIHDATYYYKCVNCIEHSAEKWTKAGTSTGIHTFAADDLAKGECTVCHHGFLRYTTSDNKVANLSQYADKKDVKSNTYANGEGVMEFNTPLGYIADNAFRNVTTLTSITIPNTVTGIGYCAFLGCKGLTGNLIIPGSVESIGQNAFCDCSGLNGYVEISNPNTQMRSDAFGGCNNVTEFRIPCSVDVSKAGIASERITRIHEMMTEHPAVEVVDCGTPGNKLYYTCSRTNCQDIYYKNLAGTEAYTGKEEVFTTLPHVFAAGDTEKSECPTCHHGFFRYTSKDNAVVTPNSPAELKAANNETLTIVSNTNVNGEGVMEFNKPLAIIGEYAFRNCTDFIGKLTIPSTVTRIGWAAFLYCTGFTGDLTIPNSVKDIGSVAFSGCTGFNGKLTLSNQLDSIPCRAFYGCNNLTGDLVIPNSVKEIGMYAFDSCSGFNGKLSIPNSVEIIDAAAFVNCSGLKGTLTIPESVRWIERYAFKECSGFERVEIKSLPYIELDALSEIATTNKVLTLSENSYIYRLNADEKKYDFPEVISATAPCTLDLTNTIMEGNSVLTLTHSIVTDPAVTATCGTDGITEGSHCKVCAEVLVAQEIIPALGHNFADNDPGQTYCTVCRHSFFRYTATAKVQPYREYELKNSENQGIYNAEKHTFADGKGVMEFDEPLTSIGERAFYECSGFTGYLTIPNSVISIGEYAFYKCSGFNGNLTIPNSVTSIGNSAFRLCSGFKDNLTIPNSVTSIGNSAFEGCSGFTGNLTIPNSVISIGESAFYKCSGFNGNLTIPNSVTSIGQFTFNGCGFTGDLTIPNSVTSIGYTAFLGCSGFTGNLTIPNSITSIGDWAFSGCSGFTGVEFQSVPKIGGSKTFSNVTSNKTVVLSDNSSVYKGSNPNFPEVVSATAPCTLDLTGSAVENHANLTRTHDYTVESDADAYLASAADCSHDATYYYKCVNCIEHSAEKWTKAGTSTGIHTFAADDLAKGECTVCHHGFLRYTTSDNKVANLSQYAVKMDVKSNTYANGEGVMEFNTPLGYISDNAFRRVTTLTSITIPNTVTGIGYCAFLGCSGLTGNLIIPGSVESIGQNAFCDCSGLNGYVEISNPNTQMRSDAFGDCNNVTEFRIPCSVDVSNAGIASERITRIHEMMTEHPAVEAVDCGTPGNKLYYTCSRTNCQDMYYKDLAGTEAYTGKEEVFTTLPHVFAAGDTEKSECPTCHHGFFRYTSKDNAVVTPKSPAQLKAANNGTLTIVSNTNVNGEGVMEFNKPLAIIGARAFEYCKDFTGKLTIPSTVTRIESKAFAHCDGFTGDLTIPNSVKDIGSEAFAVCTGFNGKLTLSNQLDSIPCRAFYGCNNLTGDLVIPNSVKEIGMYAFDSCSGFNGKLSIPNSVEIIDYGSFYDCSGLKGTLTIPESVRWIDELAFKGCSGFSSIEMKSLPYIEWNAFDGVTLNKVLTLNDDSYVSDDFSGDEVQSATYTRRGVKNQWGTIVMPFDVANGDDYDLYTLSGASDSEITLTKVTTTLEAGTPAVIRLKDGKAGNDYNLTLTGVATAESAPTTVSAELHDGTEANGLQLVGTYRPTELAAPDYFISNNKFWRAADFLDKDKSVKASPFRAYLKGVTVNAKASSLSIAIGSDSTTDMLNAITEGDSEYYDLNGRRSGSLQKGVNIIKMSDGTIKKITIK